MRMVSVNLKDLATALDRIRRASAKVRTRMAKMPAETRTKQVKISEIIKG